MTIKLSDFVFLSFEHGKIKEDDVGHLDIVVNQWWWVHPELGYVYYRRHGSLTPQTNSNELMGWAFSMYEEFGFEWWFVPLMVNRLPREVTPFNKDKVNELVKTANDGGAGLLNRSGNVED